MTSSLPRLPRDDSAADKRVPAKELLTDKRIQGLKPAPPGKRYVIWDAVQPHLGVRVTDRIVKDEKGKERAGSVSFIVMRRLPGEPHPLRHTIGQYHPKAMPLAKAREEARRVLDLIIGGTTPKEEEDRLARERQERRANTVAAVAEDYVKDMRGRGLRNAREFEAIIRREFLGQQLEENGEWRNGKLPSWRDRPIADITTPEAARLIKAIKDRGADPSPGRRRRASGGPWAAHHALAIAKSMFGWAVDQHAYGLAASPFERLKPKKLIGPKKARQRVLDDAELRVVVLAAGRMGAPFGALVRLLALTGQRLSQTAEMQRGELDLDRGLWVSPPGKMKMDKAHATPLAPAAVELLRELLKGCTHKAGFVFSTTGGARPISGFSKFKAKLDRLIDEVRREDAGPAADEIEPLPNWTLHDLRRTCRTNLPALGVADVVAEVILAHARPGLAGTYDLHNYAGEKRDALERWARRLQAILNPEPEPPSNVVEFRAGA